MIHTPEFSAKVLDAISSIEISNNGWSWVENDPKLISALRLAGYVVFEVRGAMKAFTRAKQESLAAEYAAHGDASFAVPVHSTHAPKRDEGPDYEGMILSRQERWMMDF